MNACFVVPASCKHGQSGGEFGRETAVIGSLNGGHGDAGVQIEWYAQFVEFGEQFGVFGRV